MKPKIGVMGSCSEPISDHARAMARELGESIGGAGYALITGASPGLPYESVLGAKSRGGVTVGISSGLSLAEHITKYDSPCQCFDVLIYTGSGLMGREVENIRSSDIVVILGGRSGTLGEFAIAYDEGGLIGVLRGTGGIADEVEMLERIVQKETSGHIIYGAEPAALLQDLDGLLPRGPLRPSILLRLIGDEKPGVRSVSEKCQCPPEAGAGTCELAAAPSPVLCPDCGHTGKPVNALTLKALLAVPLTEMREVDYRFCRTRDCPVVYYSADQEQRFHEQNVRERVFQKHPSEDDVFVCYCFRHNLRSIRHEAATARRSTVVAAITAGIQAGQCACDIRNPQGSCCLGNVRAVVANLAFT